MPPPVHTVSGCYQVATLGKATVKRDILELGSENNLAQKVECQFFSQKSLHPFVLHREEGQLWLMLKIAIIRQPF